MRVKDADVMGRILSAYIEAGAFAWDKFDESIEVVIRAPVPAAAVENIIPLSCKSRHPKHFHVEDEDEDTSYQN